MESIEAISKFMRSNPGVTQTMKGLPGMSYPVLVIRQDASGTHILLAYFYYTLTGFPPNIPDVYAPIYVSYVDLETREIVNSHAVTSVDFGIDRDDSKVLGKYDYIKEFTMEEFLQMEERFYLLYDKILPYFSNNESGLSGKQAQQVNEFLQLFSMIVPKIMQPYYKALNPAFFDWLKLIG